MRVVITVLESVSQTTMAYNEFVLYRNKHYCNEKQVLLKTGSQMRIPKEQIPGSVEIHQVGKDPIIIRKELKKIISSVKSNSDTYVIHLHSIRGAFSTFIAMLGYITREHTIYTIHSTYTGFKYYNKLFVLLDSLFASYVTCVSEASYDAMPLLIKKIKRNRICSLLNGVNLERIDSYTSFCCSNFDKSDGKIYYIYVARMVPFKNHKFLIDVLRRTDRRINFIFVGEEDNGAIRNYARDNCVEDRIIFTGLISRESVYQYLMESDVYITPSTLEGLPISLLEGMYCGLPVIMSDIPQHREVAADEEYISLTKLDIDAWVNEINRYANMTEEERKAIGGRCKKHVAEHFSLKTMHNKYDTIYNLIEGK